MTTKTTIAAVALAIATVAGGVSAQQVSANVQSQIDALAAQGYTNFTVKRSMNRTRIEARNANGQEAEVTVRNGDGAVLSSRGDDGERHQYREQNRKVGRG